MTDKERKEQERREFVLKLLVLRAIKSIKSGQAIKVNTRAKRMKVSFDMFKFRNAFILTPQQMAKVVELIKLDIQSRTPENTGKLRKSISGKVTGANKGQVYIKEQIYRGYNGKFTTTTNQVAKWQHFGTEGHGPVKSDYLHFKIGNSWVKTKWVEGVPETNFFEPSKKVIGQIERLVGGFIKINMRK